MEQSICQMAGQATEMGGQKPHEVQQDEMQSLDIGDETDLCNHTVCRLTLGSSKESQLHPGLY